MTCGSKSDLYARITAQVTTQLEAGVRPWTRPWTTGSALRPLRHTGQPYRGINVLLLWAEAQAKGYASPTWMTFRQALVLGGAVRKGERGATVVFAQPRPGQSARDAEDDEVGPRGFAFLRAYSVFNLAQIEGLADLHPCPEPLAPSARDARAERFFAATGIDLRSGGDVACYAPGADLVRMPDFSQFADAQAYYATLAHEATHWTGHPSRLARTFGRFGDRAYAAEELVAELGAAFLCADLGLALSPRQDHAAYIADWLSVLNDDRRFLVAAAAHAQRACDLLHGLQPT